MRRRLLFIFVAFIGTFLMMVAMKPVFLLYYYHLSAQVTAFQLFLVFIHGFSLDATVAGWFTVVPLLLVIVSLWVHWSPKVWHRILLIYFGIVTLLASAIFAVDLGLYEYWGFRLDGMLLNYLTEPSVAMASVSVWQTIRQLLFFFGYAAILFWVYYRVTMLFPTESEDKPFRMLAVLLVLGGVLFLDIRGGVGPAVANVSKAYFSTNMYLNHAATNPVFSFLSSVVHTDGLNDYNYQTDAAVEKDFVHYSQPVASDTLSQSVLNTTRPNVVLVVMESYCRTLSDEKVKGEWVGANLHRLSKEGIWFENFYSNSFRTDRGTVALLSGFPGQPNMSISKEPNKCIRLSSVARSLAKAGYSSSYLYGGDANFTNKAAYLYSVGFDSVIDKHKIHIPGAFSTSWGYADNAMFDQFYSHIIDLQHRGKPYFTTLMTISSHEPFEVPFHKFSHKKLNAFAFTDDCIGRFVEKLKHSPAWKNTLVIFVADHGYSYPDGLSGSACARFHIPMLWLGGAVSKPMQVNDFASQIDLAPTLLTQMRLPHSEYVFGKDIFNPSLPKFGYYTYINGFGVIDVHGHLVYDCSGKMVIDKAGEHPQQYEMMGKTLLQKTFIEIKKL